MLKNIPLTWKLVLILLAPLAGFLWLASLHVTESYATLKEMEHTVAASATAQRVSDLVTALQRERGASGVFIGSQGRTMGRRLPEMRKLTDAAIEALQALNLNADDRLERALQALRGLPAMRSQVDALALSSRESGARYTSVIELLIGFTHALEAAVTDAELSRALAGLNQFIEMKERAGRERAMLAMVFNQDRFDAATLAAFSRNLGEFDAYADGFGRIAPQTFVSQLEERMQQPVAQEVARLQRLGFEVPLGASLGVNSEAWFETATSRITLLVELEQALAEHVGSLAAEARERSNAALWIGVSAVLVAMLAVVGLSSVIMRNIRTSVQDVNQALVALAQRDLTAATTYRGNDEFGEISRNINNMATELQLVVKEIGEATVQVATAAEECSAVTVQTSESIERQRQGTELVVTAINEMSATVRDVARSTGDAAELSQKLNQDTVQGQHEIQTTVSLIRELSVQATETASVINELKAESDSISTVLDVIRGIADQTNLLALNAAIEAARAGEHGRGFAVVASEVRTLAQRTQESTGSIQQMIDNLQAGADRAARSMQDTLGKAQAGASNIGRTGDLLSEIAAGVAGISDRNIQIATAAEQQSAVAEDISSNVVQINDVAIQVSAGAEQTAATSLELARLADQQQGLVARFKVA